MKILSKKRLQKKAGMMFRRPPKTGGKKPEDPLDKVCFQNLKCFFVFYSIVMIILDLSRDCYPEES